ncbi:DUF58 domain-containing protein [Rhodopirellula sp. JC740]|uniref:DUF58 domain-containing protein n=1 Tax=Rhodopirellula halodulae TaxID=2894198 RepID=A0ABS8ND17_9BACT|nr:DUF58 domain-containing protein [Rhodopirellula sp. JC740]MCC9641445.1 DUF58 domain-containing protein [Rhodopirellula sp. JC740]
MRFPDLFSSRDASRTAALQWIAKQTVEGLTAGRHRSPHKGSSVEFKEHRPYVPGDELRNIDWRAFGKSDRLYIREFEEETNLRCTLLVDRSGSMRYAGSRALQLNGSGASTGNSAGSSIGNRKQDYATSVAAAIAYMMLSSQDAVGLMTFDDHIDESLPPRTTPSHLQAMLKVLAGSSRGGETDLGTVIRQAMSKLPRRSLVVLISDGLGDAESLGRSLASLRAQRQEVVFLQVLDPDEVDFPFSDRIEFRDLEDADQKEVIDSRQIRERYLESLKRHNATIEAACRRNRVDHALLTTDTPVVESLARFVTLRRGGGVSGTLDRTSSLAGASNKR